MRFSIAFVVKKLAPPFAFQCVPSHDVVGIDVSKDDILQNFLLRDDVAMNGSVPWRGPHKKANTFMQMLVETLSSLGGVVMDCTASIG